MLSNPRIVVLDILLEDPQLHWPNLSGNKFISFVRPTSATFSTIGKSESTTYASTRAIAMIDLAPQRDLDSVLIIKIAGATKQCILELEE